MRKLMMVTSALAAAMTFGAMHAANAETFSPATHKPDIHVVTYPQPRPTVPVANDHDGRRDPNPRATDGRDGRRDTDDGNGRVNPQTPARVGGHVVATTPHRTPPRSYSKAKKLDNGRKSDGRDRR